MAQENVSALLSLDAAAAIAPYLRVKHYATAGRVAIAGESVWKGRFLGATRFGCPSSRVNDAPRLWNSTPVVGSKSPEPKGEKMLWIQLTALPDESAAVRKTVSPDGDD